MRHDLADPLVDGAELALCNGVTTLTQAGNIAFSPMTIFSKGCFVCMKFFINRDAIFFGSIGDAFIGRVAR